MRKMKESVFLTHEELLAELNKPVLHECVGNEKILEDNVFENIDLICQKLSLPEIYAVDRQRRVDAGGFSVKPDIIVRHIDGSFTIFEVKKANSKYPGTGPSNQMNAVGQLLLYGNVFESVFHENIRLALIDNKIYYRTYCAFVGNNLPITLIDFQKDRLFIPYNGWR